MKQGRLAIAAASVLIVAGCAKLTMGPPKRLERDAVVMHLDAGATVEQTAQTLTQGGVEFAILSAPQDSAWFANVATRANLTSTRPGAVSGRTYAFLGPKALGDTTLTLTVPGGGTIRIHDALFELDKTRHIDLMAVQFDSTVNVQRSVNRLLEYVAGDVGATVSVLFAIEAPTQAVTDSVARLMRAIYTDLYECTAAGKAGTARGDAPFRAYFGPLARTRCKNAEQLDRGTLLGHFEIGL
jgi:hypothetical protein